MPERLTSGERPQTPPAGVQSEQDDLLAWIARKTIEVRLEESIAGLVREVLDEDVEGEPRWWGVVDLVNPTQAHYRRLHPEVERDPAVQQRLAYGRRMGREAEQWFRRIPSFVGAEGSVDGATGGIPGIRGRIDFRLGQSLVELKTSRYRMDAAENLLALSPQDLEQLVIYALITRREDEVHKLVFYNESIEGKFRVFSVRVREGPTLKQLFKARLSALNYSMSTADPAPLGRCRYLERGCDFAQASICRCSDLPAMSTDILRDAVSLVRDTSLEAELERCSERQPVPADGLIGLWDLFVPRRAFGKAIGVMSDDFAGGDEDYQLRRHAERRLSDSNLCAYRFDLQVVAPGGAAPIGLRGRGLSVKVLETAASGPVERTLPVLVRVSRRSTPHDTNSLSNAYTAQLAAHCAMRDATQGLLIVVYPEHSGNLQCFRIRYDSPREILRRLGVQAEKLARGIAARTPEGLPPCPDWIQRNCSAGCLCRPAS